MEEYKISAGLYNIGSAVFKKYEENGNTLRKTIVFTPDREKAKSVKEQLENGSLTEEEASKLTFDKSEYEVGILKIEEKHGDRYFLYQTTGDFIQILEKIFKERIRDGWYDLTKPNKPNALSYTKEEVESYPIELRASALKKIEEYEKDLKKYDHDKLFYNVIQKAIAGHKPSIFNLLFDNNDGSIERIDPETV